MKAGKVSINGHGQFGKEGMGEVDLPTWQTGAGSVMMPFGQSRIRCQVNQRHCRRLRLGYDYPFDPSIRCFWSIIPVLVDHSRNSIWIKALNTARSRFLMPRSPLRSPKPSIDLSQHLMLMREQSPHHPAAEETVAEVPAELSSPVLFENDWPLELEIGSGKGLFLATASQATPGHNFVGIEIVHKYAKHTAARLSKADCENAKIISGDAGPILRDRIAPGSLEAVHVYFPDPWWKKRHRKRRVVNETSVKHFLTALRPGGRFHFWTDVLDYFESTVEMIAAVAPEFGVPIPEQKKQSTHDLDYRTHFERRSRQNQIPVYRVRYEKRG
ncbi:tRNA (guanosine(46)-N7)-methyltransferase TrmB [Roseiconus lacunae]|uniref:tRNA (guanosine(46)-N7)-methyltransferase TrmB n=1 Tax=Roseiconus lacunae TaxID=2605694 RepID=UPI001F1BEA23|nr:tRNA (guanosine(46)-N7)-methyltransferase TrmB [Roseiconus lacunae]WRQ49841.1 tRNA (guanosine(46)-N7)-methyltransferase TrmB [Stieleria sp. HD01]